MSSPGSADHPRWQRWRDGAGVQIERVRGTLRIGVPASQRPLPRVRIVVGGWLPGWALRAVVAGLALACTALLGVGHAVWVLAAVGAVVLLVRPGGVAAPAFAVALGFRLALGPGEPYALRPYLLLAGVHLLVVLGRTASLAPWAARVDLRVLVPVLRRFLALQVLVQLIALGAAFLTSAAVTVPWLPVVVGVAVALLAWWLLSRLVPGPQVTS